MSAESHTRPMAGELEERALPEAPAPTVTGNILHGLIPYNVESRDLGGFTERIAPNALSAVNTDDLICTVNHDVSRILGRHPTTLELENRDNGMAWSCELPNGPTGQDVREAVSRGDLKATSWRMVVGRDSWDGDRRTVEEIRELRDVAIVSNPSYRAAVAELRSAPPPAQQQPPPAEPQQPPAPDQEALVPDEPTTGGPGLGVETRSASDRPTGSVAERFRRAGFPGEVASLPFSDVFEDRDLTWTGNVALLNPTQRPGVPLGADQRYLWPAFGRVPVDAGTTSVIIARQSARALAAAADVIRAIDATTPKPETSSTLELLTAALGQVASVQSGIPNIYLLQPVMNTIIEGDLTLSINAGLDKLVIDAVATAGFQAPGSDPLLVSIRKAIGTLQAAGYNPDVLVLDPASAVALDTLTATAGDQFYVFTPGAGAPGTIFGLTRRIASRIPGPAVIDSTAFGKLYSSPVSLARFEEAAGATNTSLIRLELDAVFGVERGAAAVRIAAS